MGMEAARGADRPTLRAAAEPAPDWPGAWRVVMAGGGGLRNQTAKLVWFHLYVELAGGAPRRVATRWAAIAAAVGRDVKAAREAVQDLEACRLCRLHDHDKQSGVVQLDLADPEQVLSIDSVRGQLGVLTADAQLVLPGVEAGGESALSQAKPPAITPTPYQEPKIHAHAQPNTKYQDSINEFGLGVGKRVGETAGGNADPGTLADAMLARHDQAAAEQALSLPRMAGLLRERLEGLRPREALYIAERAQQGDRGLRWSDVLGWSDVPERDRQGRAIDNRAGYFCQTVRREFRQRGIGWPFAESQGR
ncbi:MAG TPA: hypothetical protein VHY20_04715 [Pirellulales bacterium]|jgi:hypothetical protein|nr:hypothetical protein [Pirellulales bacterium]